METAFTSDSLATRQPVCSGTFYPSDPAQLGRMVTDFLSTATVPGNAMPKAVIAPHAGYIYSGVVAGSAFARFERDQESIKRIVLLGPSHHVSFEGIAVSQAEAFRTPLGTVCVDKEAIDQIRALPQICFLEAAHEHEHSLEVELPFLQAILSGFSIVPLVVGVATDREIKEVIEKLWGGRETRIVVSSDLSHYHDYETARQIDQETARLIEEGAGDKIGSRQACGHLPIRGLLLSAGDHSLKGQTLDLRNSGDTAGPHDRVVGYGAFVFD
ncbi:MAG: AmmeMemoRadiSam system protein B [Verrucomicrobiota bacterium]